MSAANRLSSIPSFGGCAQQLGMRLVRERIDVVQINVGKLCNQSCIHCHVEAGPWRKEIMSRETAELAVDLVQAAGAHTADITGGAPELNPAFRWLAKRLVKNGHRVIDRCNLTVCLEPGQAELPAFLADLGVEIVASLPCYTQENVDKQRGSGVFYKSIEVLRQLNALGYGREGSGLVLNLVYNPLGAFLPAPQEQLEIDYKRELDERFGIFFNRLLTMVNMPIGRFIGVLDGKGAHDDYWDALSSAFNPATLSQLMCLSMVSVSWDGFLFDCDFNQMLGAPVRNGKPLRLGEEPPDEIAAHLLGCTVETGAHCYACTAGAGSSCGGKLV